MAREMFGHFAAFGPPPNDGARRPCKLTKVYEETAASQVLARCASNGELGSEKVARRSVAWPLIVVHREAKLVAADNRKLSPG
jgi:hypothetical protein